MIRALLGWLDDRTGYRRLVNEALYERIPGGARWRYVFGSALVFAFVVQAITGIFLWMAYSPSDNTAWESVYYIQNQMQGGAWLRGIHHFMAQAMVVLLGLHLLQVVVAGAYKAPREVNFWLGLILMQIVLGLSLTGYLLPWDQKGYWATRVATNLMGLVPGVGQQLQHLVVGGDDYSHHTVTRFFALHAGVLPGALVLFLVMHLAVFRKHGITAPRSEGPDATFWPDQVLKDGVVCLGVLAAVLAFVYYKGADLSAPADGAREYSAARPEWYFLSLFQFLKLFEGQGETGEFIGAIVVPGVGMLVLFLMPFLGRAKAGHVFNVAFVLLVLAAASGLTYLAIREDQANPDYSNAVWAAEENAHLAQDLADEGIPPEGARYMMRTRPKAVALHTLVTRCFVCHSYTDEDGHGFALANASAPNLYGIGTQRWVEGLLDPEQVLTDNYFGGTRFGVSGEGEDKTYGLMAGYVIGQSDYTTLADAEDDEGNKLFDEQGIKDVALALADIAGNVKDPDKEQLAHGMALLKHDSGCAQCHRVDDAGYEETAPVLLRKANAENDETALRWGSRDWLIGMISDPNHGDYYGHLHSDDPAENLQQMPAFAAGAADPASGGLSPEVIEHIADFLLGRWGKDVEEAPPTTASQPVPAPQAEATPAG